MSTYSREEGASFSPYTRLRVAKIVNVHDVTGIADDPNILGTADIEWLDADNGRQNIPIAFSSFSNVTAERVDPNNPNQKLLVGFAYGDISMPSTGDVAILSFRGPTKAVILGYLPINYNHQTTPPTFTSQILGTINSSKKPQLGTIRRIISGEFVRQSKQQSEIYQDKVGAIQLTAKAQPITSESSTPEAQKTVDGSGTNAVSDIDKTTVPSTPVAKLVVGEAYTDDTFTQRLLSTSGKKVVFAALFKNNEVYQIIDADGNYEVGANSVTLLQQQKDGTTALIEVNSQGQITLWDSAGNLIMLDPVNNQIVLNSSAGDAITLGSDGDTEIQIVSQGDVTISGGSVTLNTGSVNLGGDITASPVALADVLVRLFNAHTHTLAGAPTSTPVPPMGLIPDGLPITATTFPGSGKTMSG